MTTLTECRVDNLPGDRWFTIKEGDICDSDADVLIISAAAETGGGAAVSAVHRRFGGGVLDSQRYLVRFGQKEYFGLGDFSGPLSEAFAGAEIASEDAGITGGFVDGELNRGRCLVVLRMPGANWLRDPAKAYSGALGAVFGSLGLLSADTARRFSTVAFTDLAGRRGYSVHQRLEAILAAVTHWFSGPAAGQRVELILFNDGSPSYAKRRGEWISAMRQRFGWTPTAVHRKEIRIQIVELRAIVGVQQEGRHGSETRRALHDLFIRLDPEHPRSVQEIAQAGRSLAEALSAELCRAHGLKVDSNSFGNIDRLEKCGGAGPRVAKWILSYLHTMRTLGNEASHVVRQGDGEDRYPSELGEDDLQVLLTHIRRVLHFRNRWLEDSESRARTGVSSD